MMRLVRLVWALLVLAMAGPALAQEVSDAVAISSPDGSVEVRIGTDGGEGHPTWTMSRKGKLIIAPSRLGF